MPKPMPYISNFDSLEHAQSWLDEVVTRVCTLDMEEILTLFSDDVVVNYGLMPQMVGLATVDEFMRPRYARKMEFELSKIARCLTGNVVGLDARASYRDSVTGLIIKERAHEFLTMKGGVICAWSCVTVRSEFSERDTA